MCEDPNVWYTEAGERVVDEILSNSTLILTTEKSEFLNESFTDEVVLIDLSTGVIED